jgi:thymidylate synthase
MKQFAELYQKIIDEGEERKDRTGVGTLSIFGGHLSFDLRERFPLVTMKKTLWKSAFIEMLWFLRGENNTKFLKHYDVKIWDAWADENGNLGPIYGVQWRKWPGKTDWAPKIDQIRQLIDGIKNNPTGRRHIVSAWNPTFLNDMGLPPCHRDFQCYASNDGHLDLMLAIRSWDTALGGPFNVAQYALLTHLLARATGLTPRYLKINYGDAHLYLNHVEPIKQMLQTCPPIECPTKLVINTVNTDIDGYKIEDFDIIDYDSHPFIKLPIAV